jgi:CubicO group peptidase (beta-lactamase class C family)
VKVPERNGRAITLADLATQTSGLPLVPTDFPMGEGPAYSGYSLRQVHHFLSTYSLSRDPGAGWEYSHLGFGLLGQALERRAGQSYEALVRARIAAPLGMNSTAIHPTGQMKSRLATGHDAQLEPALTWWLPAMEGAASLRSTVNDLLNFLAALMDYTKSILSRAMAAMLETLRPAPTFRQGLGWCIYAMGPGDPGFVTHMGSTFGYSAVVAYDPQSRVGVVVLSNSAADDGGLAWHLMRPDLPVVTSAVVKAIQGRNEIVLDPKLLERYAGEYQSPAGVIAIERRGTGLYFKSAAAPKGIRLHPESEQKFFIREADLELTFLFDSWGRASGMIIHYANSDTLASRN